MPRATILPGRVPKYNLEAGSGSHAEETARMLVGIEKVLLEEKPEVVLAEGDTNSVLAAPWRRRNSI